jgi:hypothetical protein
MYDDHSRSCAVASKYNIPSTTLSQAKPRIAQTQPIAGSPGLSGAGKTGRDGFVACAPRKDSGKQH